MCRRAKYGPVEPTPAHDYRDARGSRLTSTNRFSKCQLSLYSLKWMGRVASGAAFEPPKPTIVVSLTTLDCPCNLARDGAFGLPSSVRRQHFPRGVVARVPLGLRCRNLEQVAHHEFSEGISTPPTTYSGELDTPETPRRRGFDVDDTAESSWTLTSPASSAGRVVSTPVIDAAERSLVGIQNAIAEQEDSYRFGSTVGSGEDASGIRRPLPQTPTDAC